MTISKHLRRYQPKIAVSYNRAVMIQLFAVIGGGVSALIVVPVYDDYFFVFGVAGDDVAGSADLSVASLRGCRRVIDHHIMHEPDFQIVKHTKERKWKRIFTLQPSTYFVSWYTYIFPIYLCIITYYLHLITCWIFEVRKEN